jgi:hypothetical protein
MTIIDNKKAKELQELHDIKRIVSRMWINSNHLIVEELFLELFSKINDLVSKREEKL